MAYYRGDYYRGKGRGDYYRGKGRGDPGFWSAIGKGLGVVGAAIAAPYTGGATLGLIPSILGGVGTPQGATSITTPPFVPNGGGAMALTRMPNVQQITLRKLPAGNPPMAERDINLPPEFRRRRRTMNPGNVKALRRSLRRVSSFGRLCKSARKAIGQAATAVQVRRGQRALPPARRAR